MSILPPALRSRMASFVSDSDKVGSQKLKSILLKCVSHLRGKGSEGQCVSGLPGVPGVPGASLRLLSDWLL